MKILGFLLLLAVGSKAGINKLFFSGGNIFIDCPVDGQFYQWKKYYGEKMTTLLSDDKSRLSIPLNAEYSPITYECTGMSGFSNENKNITVFVLDQQSAQARKLCFLKKADRGEVAQYPCFLQDQKEPVTRISKGSSVTLDCEAGGANVSYIWYKLNTPVSHQEYKYKYTNIPVLRMVDLDEKLAGQYLCIVNNTSGNNLKRYFDLQISEIQPRVNKIILINGPIVTNITIKLHKSHTLTCDAEATDRERINIVQWAKKIDDDDKTVIDKSLIIKWADSLYRMIPDNQVHTERPSLSSVSTSLELKTITEDSGGQYICAFFTSVGKMTHKSFFLTIDGATDPNEGTQRSFLFLYILIPSLIIAVCLFVGIYLTINRRVGRKPVSLSTGTAASNCFKTDPETMRLRTTPEYSMNSYPNTNAPPTTTQYLVNSNYPPGSYFQTSDKMIL